MRTLLFLALSAFPTAVLASDEDEAEATLRLIAARRHKPTEPAPAEKTGFHQERAADGTVYTLPDGWTLAPAGGQPRPFSVGDGTPPTGAPSAVRTSSSSAATTPTVRTITPTVGLRGVTNCPPSG